MDTLVGVVTSFAPPYYRVECETAPREHLRIHHLVASQMNGVTKIGQRVELKYESTPRFGYWVVSRIL